MGLAIVGAALLYSGMCVMGLAIVGAALLYSGMCVMGLAIVGAALLYSGMCVMGLAIVGAALLYSGMWGRVCGVERLGGGRARPSQDSKQIDSHHDQNNAQHGEPSPRGNVHEPSFQ